LEYKTDPQGIAVSTYMAHKVKDLVKEQGILSSPNPKQGYTLPLLTVSLVQDFYK